MEQPTSTITVGEIFGKELVPNITIEDAKFWGRPNFRGEENQFKDSRRMFNVLIQNDLADQLRSIGYPVKTLQPKPERLAEDPDAQPLSFLKVMIDDVVYDDEGENIVKGPKIVLMQGDKVQRLDNNTMAVMDRANISRLDLEIRAWNYNWEEVRDGKEDEPKFSARLVTSVGIMRPSVLADKYGNL